MGRAARRAAVGIGVAIGAVWAFGFWAYASHDRMGFIDHPEVVDAAQSTCGEMRRRVDEAGSLASADERRSAENAAILDMTDEIRRVGVATLEDDRPALDWLRDWERLVAARKAGEPVPRDDGEPIPRRMNDLAEDSGLEVCRVPPVFDTDG